MHVLQELGVAVFVVTMTVTVGLDLTWEHMFAVFRRPQTLLGGMAVNYLAVPAFAVLATRLLGLEPAVSAGVLLISVAPGGPVGPVLVRGSGGNLALATSLAVTMSVANTVLTPALAGLLAITPEGASEVPVLEMMRTIVLYQLVPLALSVGWRTWHEASALRWLRWSKVASNVVLVVVSVVFLATSGSKALEVPAAAFGAIVPTIVVSLVLGYLAARTPADRIAVSLTSGIRSMSVVLLVVAAWYPDPRTLFCGLGYSVSMFILSAAAGLLVNRRAPAAAAGSPGEG